MSGFEHRQRRAQKSRLLTTARRDQSVNRLVCAGGTNPTWQRALSNQARQRLLFSKIGAAGQSQKAVMPQTEASLLALRGGGHPLPRSMRAFYGSRLGGDLSKVRVHTDARANKTAQDMDARAFTVGHDIVFGEGEYAPNTISGKRLLAHELTHVLQQRARGTCLQRKARCPRRPNNEVVRSRHPKGFLRAKVVFDEVQRRLEIRDFPVGRATLPSGTTDATAWQRAMSIIAGDPSIKVAVTGYTDCIGTHGENFSLRQTRNKAVIRAMPPSVKSKVLFKFVGSTTDFPYTNTTAEGRARNRSVRVTYRQDLARGQDACEKLPHARNADEYLFLVRCLERRLNLTAAGKAPITLSLLRQIYFGTKEWSRTKHSLWSKVITRHPWSPGRDPRPLLGRLFPALKRSNVVDGSKMGHLLAGLDAMMRPQKVTVGLQTGVPNEEWATWAGDVGQAAAKYATDEFYDRRKGNYVRYFVETASDADLLGDIDSFAIRVGLAGASDPQKQLMQRLKLNRPLSEILLQYFRLSKTRIGHARAQRIQSFITAYGGVVEGSNLKGGRKTLTTRLARRVREFAGYFSIYLMTKYGDPPKRKAGSQPFAQLIANAVKAITNLFVNWLIKQLKR
ncbi:MAG: DUF4157 domain-containing protein [Anaerolineales bacterium]|nr:DUF4157 domain-containing protein [Anaerolineales bacterium]